MDTDLDTLATALYVTTDDLLRAHPRRVPARPKGSIEPRISDAEMLTLAVMQAVLGYPSETRWPASCPPAPAPLVPGPAAAAGLQQASAEARVHDELADRAARPPSQRGHQ